MRNSKVGKLILDLPELWARANQEERRKFLLNMLDSIYAAANRGADHLDGQSARPT
ncbi:hypothetical protein ACFLVH_00340 [Chloroflexota bacterium]